MSKYVPPKGAGYIFFFLIFFILSNVEYFGFAKYVLAYLKEHACRLVVLIAVLLVYTTHGPKEFYECFRIFGLAALERTRLLAC